MRVAAVVLAAGGSRRMGRDKLTLSWRGKSLLQHVLATALDAGLARVVTVVRPASPEGEIARSMGCEVVENPSWEEGISTSLKAGIGAVDDQSEAAVILLGDEPGVEAAAIRDLVRAVEEGAAPAGRIVYRDRVGHPVILGRQLFESIGELQGDRGAGTLLATLEGVVELRLPWPAPTDIDRPEDLHSA